MCRGDNLDLTPFHDALSCLPRLRYIHAIMDGIPISLNIEQSRMQIKPTISLDVWKYTGKAERPFNLDLITRLLLPFSQIRHMEFISPSFGHNSVIANAMVPLPHLRVESLGLDLPDSLYPQLQQHFQAMLSSIPALSITPDTECELSAPGALIGDISSHLEFLTLDCIFSMDRLDQNRSGEHKTLGVCAFILDEAHAHLMFQLDDVEEYWRPLNLPMCHALKCIVLVMRGYHYGANVGKRRPGKHPRGMVLAELINLIPPTVHNIVFEVDTDVLLNYFGLGPILDDQWSEIDDALSRFPESTLIRFDLAASNCHEDLTFALWERLIISNLPKSTSAHTLQISHMR